MKKLTYITAAVLLVAGLAAAPAFAQGKMSKMPMKGHHTKSCYDHAWESQAQKDCLAGKTSMSTGKKSMKKAAAPKKT
jgi:hypothetical protein